MDLAAKRQAYETRREELLKYHRQVEEELERVRRVLLALGGAIEVLDELLQAAEGGPPAD